MNPPAPFTSCRLSELPLESVRAHDGQGLISFHRVVDHDAVEGPLNFIDLAVLPPGTSIGEHRHADDEEEYYLILDGCGTMARDGETFAVRAGDLVRNRPGGRHGLRNDSTEPLRIFVFELAVTR